MAKAKEEKKEEVLLTEAEVWDIIRFARGLSTSYLTPDLISARMRDVSLNPLAATSETLASAMADPKNHEAQLQQFSQDFEIQSMVYKRLLAYLSNMLAFDVTYTSSAKGEDYTSPKYQKDLKAVEDFLDRFEYRKELRVAVREMLRNDAFFGCFVDTGDKYVLQELPSEYCKITGRWEGGFLFSFNMYWFIQPGVDINMYPNFFKKKYRELWGSGSTTQKYIPSLQPELRTRSTWIYWVDIPVTFGVCFKLSPEIATRLPYFTPLFNDLILQGLMRNLQKNMNMAAANKIIMGQVPMLNKDAKATVKDSIAISPDLLGKFMALVKAAIGDAVKVASAPLEEIEDYSFDTDNEMYSSYLRTALASSGINTNLIFSDNIKPNAIETQLSLNVDEQMMTALYEQFEDFMNYFINKRTKTFKFTLNFEGTEFFLDRQARLDKAMQLFDKGIVLPQKIAAAYGMKPSTLRKHMEEAAAMDFMGKLTPPSLEGQKEMVEVQAEVAEDAADQQLKNQKELAKENAKNVAKNKPATPNKLSPTPVTVVKAPAKPASEGSKGRPRKSISELGEEGMKTRETGGNVGRGGKTP